jgi:hypothetical protein
MNNTIRQSLDEIAPGYSIFEHDQVLTHDQLNTVADYFDDQTRLTRTELLGVGIICGLRVSVEGSNVRVSAGIGVTTDGDLLFLPDSLFEQYRTYDGANATYDPFAPAVEKKKIYELLPKTPAGATPDAEVVSLTQFKNEAGGFEDKVAVLFMEGYVKDEDLCNGTDCDNLGQSFVSTIKLLLVDKKFAGPLNKTIPASDEAARALKDIVADRPLFSPLVSTPQKLADTYRAACSSIHAKLIDTLPGVYDKGSPFLGGLFAANPATGWRQRLVKIKNDFSGSDSGIQYYYDFLKDVVETYNRFREFLFGDSSWCSPDAASFPKHVLLGNVVAGADSQENRTSFYPSPLVSRTIEQLSHAKFLAQKLDALIQTFALPANSDSIRVTPSRFEDAHLEERAIPYYYETRDATNPIEQRWSFRLHVRGMDAWNYSYNADTYGAQGAAAKPLAAQTGCFPFFRIEGHLGQIFSTALKKIEDEIKNSNLPFVVQGVLLGAEKDKVVKKPGIRYTDLHRFHQILRTDLTYQLDDVRTFSTNYLDQVNKLGDDDVEDATLVKSIASNQDRAISNGVLAGTSVLSQDYILYKNNAAAWKPSVKETITAAAGFKQNLGKVTKTEFTTPFDSLIATSHGNWLDWLDIIIQDKDDKETEKLLFSNFQSLHPGLEHFAGVGRGGTFVLVYDSSNRVVADFMLPYHCCEPVPEIQPQEPGLPRPPIKLPDLDLSGIKVTPSIGKFLDHYAKTVIDPKIDIQKDYVRSYTDSLNTMVGVLSRPAGVKTAPPPTKFADPLLDAAIGETRLKKESLELLKTRASDPTLPAETRAKYAALVKNAEGDLAKSIHDTATYVSDAGVDVSPGSEGFNAMLEVSDSMEKISDAGTRTTMKTNLTNLQKNTGNAQLKTMLGVFNV